MTLVAIRMAWWRSVVSSSTTADMSGLAATTVSRIHSAFPRTMVGAGVPSEGVVVPVACQQTPMQPVLADAISPSTRRPVRRAA